MNEQLATILIAEDEPKLSALLVDYLQAEGFRACVVADGNQVVSAVREQTPDLLLLDLMLPNREGFDVCRELRDFTQIPILIVTARAEEADRLHGLELGADDYICKPFSPREVVARIKAVLRRTQSNGVNKARGLVIEEAEFAATLNGLKLDLTPAEFRLLKTFAAAPGRVFSRQQLMDSVYVDDRIVTDRTVDSHVKNLRRKLNDVSPKIEWIESVYGVGYRFNAH